MARADCALSRRAASSATATGPRWSLRSRSVSHGASTSWDGGRGPHGARCVARHWSASTRAFGALRVRTCVLLSAGSPAGSTSTVLRLSRRWLPCARPSLRMQVTSRVARRGIGSAFGASTRGSPRCSIGPEEGSIYAGRSKAPRGESASARHTSPSPDAQEITVSCSRPGALSSSSTARSASRRNACSAFDRFVLHGARTRSWSGFRRGSLAAFGERRSAPGGVRSNCAGGARVRARPAVTCWRSGSGSPRPRPRRCPDSDGLRAAARSAGVPSSPRSYRCSVARRS